MSDGRTTPAVGAQRAPIPDGRFRPHFVQRCAGPVFIGQGSGTLACGCGQVLIEGYDPARFLAVALQCGQCDEVTVTPSLADETAPPFAVVIAEPLGEPRESPTTLPPSAFIIGRTEMDRITALYQPAEPGSNLYAFTSSLLDEAEEAYRRQAGAALPAVESNIGSLRVHALAWSIGHIRERMRDDGWACLDAPPISSACCHVAGFLHFQATWGHHPLFPAMFATAAEKGFSLHALTPFAAAYCLSRQGNRVGFPRQDGFPGRIEAFSVATGPTETLPVLTRAFDRYDYPSERPWDPAVLKSDAQELIEAEQARINPRNPGLLVVSLGATMGRFDEVFIGGVQAALSAVGRKHRGLMAVAPAMLRLLPAASSQQVQFGYGFFPVANRHYRGDTIRG